MRRAIVVATLAVLTLLPGCGGGDEALSRDEFISKANAICRDAGAAVESAVERTREQPSDAEIRSFAEDTFIPELETLYRGLRDLTPPEELQDGLEEYLDEFEKSLADLKDRVEDDPRAIGRFGSLFRTASDDARDLGLAECSSTEEASEDARGSQSDQGTTEEGPTDSLSFTTWQEETRAVCQEYEPQVDALEAELGEPETPSDLVAYIDALFPLNDSYTDELLAVPVPAERAGEVRRVYELYEAVRQSVAALRSAAADGDEAATETHAQALLAQGTEVEGLLEDLSLPECVTNP